MKQERKICFRITAGRIAGAVVISASLINLIIVGVVSAIPAPPSTMTPTQTVLPAAVAGTSSPPAPPLTDSPEPILTLTPTAPFSETPGPTPTYTMTPTLFPSLTPCIMQSNWPIYVVQPGDTLFSLAPLTGSTVSQLMLANCLSSDLIYAGQLLYVPRPPIPTASFTPSISPTNSLPTWTFTPSMTPTNTIPPDTPTDFQDPNISCDPPAYAAFSVLPSDPQGVSSVSVIVVIYDPQIQGTFGMETLMNPRDNTYDGSLILASPYTVYSIAAYYFRAADGIGNNTVSQAYYADPSSSCSPPQPAGTERAGNRSR